jgi:hypothetical protein
LIALRSLDFTEAVVRETLPAAEAKRRILQETAQPGLHVRGRLDLSGSRTLTTLPADLTADILDLHDCPKLETLPTGLQVRRLNLSGCQQLSTLPSGLRCYELELRETTLRELPADLQVEFRLDLQDCRRLRTLPTGLKVGSLNLRGCVSLEALPEGLDVYFLDLTGCVSLTGWPQRASVRVGRLSVSGCEWLLRLPSWLKELAQLDVSDCPNLFELPEGLHVSSTLEIAGSGLRRLPTSMRSSQLRWRGVPVDRRIAFLPETITVDELLAERNVERRRVLLERMGYERFAQQASAELLDQDRDPGGERRLLKIPLPEDEDLVCVSVICPSTDRQYVIRVPPTMRTCRQAVAWIAGYDNPDDYRPVAET